jgi:hypothetical protein
VTEAASRTLPENSRSSVTHFEMCPRDFSGSGRRMLKYVDNRPFGGQVVSKLIPGTELARSIRDLQTRSIAAGKNGLQATFLAPIFREMQFPMVLPLRRLVAERVF